MYPYGFGGNVGDGRDGSHMDPMAGQNPGQHLLSHPRDLRGDSDISMNDLAADMLPFDLDLSALPDSTSQDIALGNAVSAEDTSGNAQNDEKKDNSGDIVIGAGPLPTGFGVQLAPGQGSTLTEFTKRRNWSQRIIEELKDFLHVLSPEGRLLYVSPSSKSLTGYESSELVGKIISDFIHTDDNHVFAREFNESIATGNPLRFFYRFRKADGSYMILECHGHPHLSVEPASFANNSSAGLCRGFFMMARRYPTKNSALLDSFLEHKVENERLRKRIAELKREEQEDMEGQKQLWPPRPTLTTAASTDSMNAFGGATNSGEVTNAPTPSDYNSMPRPAKPTVSNVALTQQNLDEVLASSQPDSIKDKMARYEGATHIETIEMLTGLRYRDGERSKGISTGDQSPTLIRGDAGIPIQVDKNGRPTQSGRAYSNSPYGEHGDKKKKLKVADEYVCTDCGTLDSPEWRKGPSGPKTLCNACGLRWAKKEKKRGGYRSDNGSANGNGGSMFSTPAMGQQTPSMSSDYSMTPQQLSGTTMHHQMTTMPGQSNPPGTTPIAPSTSLTFVLPNRGPPR